MRISSGVRLVVPLTVLASLSPVAPTAPFAVAESVVPLNSCTSSDHGAPVVDRVTASREQLDVRRRGRSVVVDAVLRDTGGPGAPVGVGGATVFAFQDGASAAPGPPDREMTRLDAEHWRGVLRFPRGSRPGRWIIGASPRDTNGLYSGYFDPRLPPKVTAHLDVLGRADRRAPVATAVRLRPTTIDARTRHRRLRVTVFARDAVAGVEQVRISLRRAGASVFSLTDDSVLHRVSGTEQDGRWRGHVDLPWRARRGRWDTLITLLDRVGNARSYSSVAGTAAPRGLRPVRVLGDVDRVAPTASEIAISTTTVDIRGSSATLTMQSRLSDAGSGVTSVTGWVQRGAISEYEVPMHLVAGTATDGLWRGSWTAETCRVLAASRTVRVDARDRAQNHGSSGPAGPAFDVLNDDHEAPMVASATIAAASLTVRFTEDVFGISPDSAYVLGVDDAATDPPVAGHWVCSDAAAVAVDCRAGPVRAAEFRADAPFDGLYQSVVINPEHVLDVTDIAGNAYASGRRNVGFPPKGF